MTTNDTTHTHTCVEVGRLNGEIEALRRDNTAYANENARLRQQRDAHTDVAEDRSTDRPVCGEPADASRFFRCQKDAGHTGDRHHVDFGVGSYTWGYVPTPAEKAEKAEATR